MDKTYTAKDVYVILGITASQLFHWKRTWGLVKPVFEAKGRSGKDLYDYDNLVRLSFIQKLSAFGIDLRQVKHILNHKSLNDTVTVNTLYLKLVVDIPKIKDTINRFTFS